MAKVRIYELAKTFKISSNALINVLRKLKFDPKSHMSVATDEMIAAVKKKFAEGQQEIKKEMKQQEQIKAAVKRKSSESKKTESKATERKTSVGKISTKSGSTIESIVKKFDKKQKKKDRRKKKVLTEVDKKVVAKTFKSTMANLEGIKSKKRYKKSSLAQDQSSVENQNTIEVTEFMSVAEIAKMVDVKPAEIIGKLFELGMMATMNQRLDMDTIEMIADDYGLQIVLVAEVGEDTLQEENTDDLIKRAPVVTVMGHVDHGKTSLLDYIRNANVVSGEAGAITQHIGAYDVVCNGEKITFLDTPGHEAFTAMRARGAQITDIVVLVVAADDGVRPQTIEAIDHARAANVPIVVAINKIDKPNANPDSIRNELSNQNLLSEEWGGKTIMVEISAKHGTNVEKILEMILLQAEMLDLMADPKIRAQGVVVDARLEKGRGTVVTVLVQKGTCKVGDSVVAGVQRGRIRTITDEKNNPISCITPSMPAQITGLGGVPQAGDSFMACLNDQEAREISGKRAIIKREHDARNNLGGITLDQIFERIKEGQIKELRLIIKGDVDGSVEVLSDTLGKIQTNEVKTTILRKSVGAISESDVILAAASGAFIIGFHVSIDSRARELAKKEKVDIRLYDIIYEAEDDVKKALEGMLSPVISEKFVGEAEVRDIFKVPKIGSIAGSYVRSGRFKRSDKVKLSRDGKIIYTGTLNSLRRFKDDVKEVKEGFECGIGLENYNDIKVGDIIEAYEIVETARTLDDV